MSASRICPAKAAGALDPTDAPGALAVITRVKASTPLVKPSLGWLKQMVLSAVDIVLLIVGAGVCGAHLAERGRSGRDSGGVESRAGHAVTTRRRNRKSPGRFPSSCAAGTGGRRREKRLGGPTAMTCSSGD